jgi:hypothetical protein
MYTARLEEDAYLKIAAVVKSNDPIHKEIKPNVSFTA